MNEYLRDFINDNVSPACGGNESIVNPNTIQQQLNTLKSRVDQLEAGISFVVKVKDQITIPFNRADTGFSMYGVVPTNGTITMAAVLLSDTPSLIVWPKINIEIYRQDSLAAAYQEDGSKYYKATAVVVNIPVYAGDHIVVSVDGAIDSGSADQNHIISCMATLELPEKIYGVTNA